MPVNSIKVKVADLFFRAATPPPPYQEEIQSVTIIPPGQEKRRISIPKQIKEFSEKTSCHGVKRIFDLNVLYNGLRWKNIVWSLLTLAGFGMSCWSLGEIFTDYMNHPVSTALRNEYNGFPDFPAVTFCNTNLFVPQRNPLYNDYVEYWEKIIPFNVHYTKREKLIQLMASFGLITKEEQMSAGHTLEEMLVECFFAGEPCTADDFYRFYDYHYGNCYTFNFGISNNASRTPIRSTQSIGKGTGLILKLDTRSDLYLDLTEEVGIKLMIHEAREKPYMEEEGVTVAPGFFTTFGVSMAETILAKAPYGICKPEDGDGNKDVNMFASFGYRYSRKTCLRSCQQAYVMRICGCCDRHIPCNPDGFQEIFGVRLPDQGNPRICNNTYYEDGHCLIVAYNDPEQILNCQKSCPPRCRVKSFEFKHASALWPTRMQAEEVFDEINGSERIHKNNTDIDDKLRFVRDNVATLAVDFASRINKVEATEPTYTWNTLLCNVGGQLGLFLGFSLLTAFEFLELFLDGVILSIKTFWKYFKVYHVTSRHPKILP